MVAPRDHPEPSMDRDGLRHPVVVAMAAGNTVLLAASFVQLLA